jgi:hypothetical protein
MFRVKLVQAASALDLMGIHQVLQQELTDMSKGEAPVQKVAKVTQERHQIIDQIRDLNAQFNPE